MRKLEHDASNVAHKVEHRSEEAYGAAKARSSELARRAGERFDGAKEEGRGMLRRGEEEVGNVKRRAEGEVEKGSWRGSATAEKDAVSRQYERKYEHDKELMKEKVGELKQEVRCPLVGLRDFVKLTFAGQGLAQLGGIQGRRGKECCKGRGQRCGTLGLELRLSSIVGT